MTSSSSDLSTAPHHLTCGGNHVETLAIRGRLHTPGLFKRRSGLAGEKAPDWARSVVRVTTVMRSDSDRGALTTRTGRFGLGSLPLRTLVRTQ